MLRQRTALLYLILFILLTACSSATVEPPATTVATTPPEAPEATAALPVEESPAPIAAGQTEDGLFFRGRPDAPVTLIDYSDFQ